MADWPKDTLDVTPRGILSTSDENCPLIDLLTTYGLQFSSPGIWPVANTALYFPVLVRAPVTIYQMAWTNGGTLGSNVDAGIYDGGSKARLVSTGSTAQSGASTLQAVDVADTLIPPGLHYLAMVMDSTTGQVSRTSVSATAGLRVCGAAQQASAFPLPSTATFAPIAVTLFPLIMAAIAGSVL